MQLGQFQEANRSQLSQAKLGPGVTKYDQFLEEVARRTKDRGFYVFIRGQEDNYINEQQMLSILVGALGISPSYPGLKKFAKQLCTARGTAARGIEINQLKKLLQVPDDQQLYMQCLAD